MYHLFVKCSQFLIHRQKRRGPLFNIANVHRKTYKLLTQEYRYLIWSTSDLSIKRWLLFIVYICVCNFMSRIQK